MAIPMVKLEYQGDPPSFCCPVCGQKIFTEDAEGGLCNHVVFAGETFTGEWLWNNSEWENGFNQAAEKALEELKTQDDFDFEDYTVEDFFFDEGIEKVAEIAAGAFQSESAFLLSVQSSSIGACGPSGGGFFVIIDYSA